jgi:hydrogenase maturation protein HypF
MNDNLLQAEIRVVGVVQGIGFRPFIYSLATKRNLTGYVLNTGNSAVQIIVEGRKNEIIEFIESIENDKPHLAVIDNLTTKWRNATGAFTNFEIRISQDEKQAGGSIIPADIGICEKCTHDINDKESRHYKYPFTCCAICGPRFTTVIDTPYDRERTTMQDFPLCNDCEHEFTDPAYRRYNAQTICCPKCGPKFHIIEKNGKKIETDEVFPKTVQLLNDGAIIAIKGLGGIHLAVAASNDEKIMELRRIRNKPTKPLAIMSPNIESISKFAIITPYVKKLLLSWRRPIVVLKKKAPFKLAPSLAPGLDTIGVMLPYSGIYQCLFNGLEDLALVMTSANPAGLPTIIQATTFQKQFMEMADYFLTHNRTIYQRCDDSVIIPNNKHYQILRRSRGYTPEPIETVNDGLATLAVGALEKNTGAIYHGKRIFLTQHIGDVDTIETLNFLQYSIKHLQKLLRVDKFHSIACDLHPDFLTTRFAEQLSYEQDIPLVRIQHHHSHLASLLIDNQLPSDQEIVAICCDGTGYGPDKTIWGGEILTGHAKEYQRSGYLKPQPMPGGDLAAKYPLRMLIGILSQYYSREALFSKFQDIAITGLPQGKTELEVVIEQGIEGINSPLTSSTGRLLDSLSALLGVCYKRTYEGEPAIRLETYANAGKHIHNLDLKIPITKENGYTIIDTGELVKEIFNNRTKYRGPDLAFSSHIALGKTLAKAAVTIAKQKKLSHIGFSGGVAYNQILTRTIRQVVQENSLNFLSHQNIPPGDAGISAGQALIARAKSVTKK